MLPKINTIISFVYLLAFLWHMSEAIPLRRHVRSLQNPESKLSQKDIEQKLSSLRHKRKELLKYKRILQDLNEILTDYDDSEYVDLSENEVHHEDLLEVLKHLVQLEIESKSHAEKSTITKKSSQNSNSKLLKSKVVEYDDYDPMTMQSDMPSRNDLDSGEADGQANNGNLNPSILEKFNLTREDLLALSTKMQNNGKSGSNGRLDFTTNGRAETEGTQQDASITMSPQQLREVFNLTVNGDGKVQYDRNLTEEELAERAKQLALQQIKKSMLTYFVHSGTQSGTKVADQTQLERERPANLNRKPIQQRHISEAHRVFLSHAQQMQDQPSDMSLSRNNADIDMLSSTFTEKNIAFHPRCELPKNTDAESWNDSDALNLLFNVSSSIRPEKPNLTLETATLRIYIISPDSANSKHRSRNDDQIRISVSWYTRSLKKQRVKRKLSDSKMVHSSFTGWIELNLKGAVSSWKTTARNHGIAITVEDQEGNALRADSYIQKHDCANLYPRPFPWLVHKKLPYDDADISYRFPRLDILTREIVDYNYQGLPSLVENIHNAPSAHQSGL